MIETLNMFLALSRSGLLPTWSYNPGLDTWSIAMDLYAFSDPQPAGSISGTLVATPARRSRTLDAHLGPHKRARLARLRVEAHKRA